MFFLPAIVLGQEKEKVDADKIQFGGVYKNTISLNAGGTSGLAGVSYERLLTKNLLFDVGVGYLGGGVGFHFYPWMVQRGKIRLKLQLSSTYMAWPGASTFQSNYIGVGGTLFTTNKLNIHLDLGPSYFYHYSVAAGKDFPDRWFLMGNFKLGYRFSFYSHKRRKKYLQDPIE